MRAVSWEKETPMFKFDKTRRRLVVAAGAGLMLTGTSLPIVQAAEKRDDDEKEVGAVEDLMREHGVLRRAILAYRDMAVKLRSKPAALDPEMLRRTAALFRSFGEDYHERKLEEAHIFPTIKKVGGPAAAYVDVLISQHRRGRELTDYIFGVVGKGGVTSGDVDPLARVLDSVELMYEHHAAREDTVVFPAWKDALSAYQLDEMGEKFEEIERQQFGKDGFEDAVAQIALIEQALGITDLAQFTAPPPPKG
jgi:hemerythrin-like domain-containing protein